MATVQDQENEHHGMSTRHGEEDGWNRAGTRFGREPGQRRHDWRLLSARQIPRDDCCFMGYSTLEVLGDVSEAQVDEKIIPVIADLDVPLVTNNQQKLIQAIREATRSHGT